MQASAELDPSFGVGGVATLPEYSSNYRRVIDLIQQGNTTLVGVLAEYDGAHRYAMARFDADGKLDPTFGNGDPAGGVYGLFKDNIESGCESLAIHDSTIWMLGWVRGKEPEHFKLVLASFDQHAKKTSNSGA